MKIGIIVAMDKELARLRDLLDGAHVARHGCVDFIVGNVGGKEVVLQKCGIGKVNSAVGTVEMIDNYRPDVVVSSGVAGGACDCMKVCDMVVGTEYRYHDAYCGDDCAFGQIAGMPVAYTTPKELVDKARAAGGDTAVYYGLIVSGDWFVDSQNKMRAILSRFPDTAAVDMESCSIAQVCHVRGVPFVSFRVISDVPLSDHKASQYFDFWDRLADGAFGVTKRFIEIL